MNYYIEAEKLPLSLHPLDVDRLLNHVISKSLIGTLLTTDQTHRRAAFLAERWENSLDFRKWTFHLRPDLHCEDGSRIDANHFVKSFNWLLRIHASRNPKVTAFSKLEGWDEFLAGKRHVIEGLVAKDPLTVEFSFAGPMDVGFLAFLSIPQFGFYCQANFNSNGEWANSDSFVSSGPFRLVSKEDGVVTYLEARAGWPLLHDSAPKAVTVYQTDVATLDEETDRNSLIIKANAEVDKIPPGFLVVEGARTKLRSLVVSPNMDNLFKNKNNRQVFRTRLLKWLEKNPHSDAKIVLARSFYSDHDGIIGSSAAQPPVEYQPVQASRKNLKLVYARSIPENVVTYYLSGISYALEGSGVSFAAGTLDPADKDSMRKFLSNRDFDFRLMGSVIGGGISNWIIDMMFCSSLGVCFPDPSGRMCQLVKAQELQPVPELQYAERFNEILEDDASVIPLHHSGAIWIFGPGISSESVSPLSPVPHIEQLRVN